ncbi:calcium-binding protein, partial [Lysobacter sp. 1R34A]|uniref:calcium-binding protein n=1 Tax=Lysobacter sp. 1R34A TaxID=3445786 RepID=UPI003EEB30C3
MSNGPSFLDYISISPNIGDNSITWSYSPPQGGVNPVASYEFGPGTSTGEAGISFGPGALSVSGDIMQPDGNGGYRVVGPTLNFTLTGPLGTEAKFSIEPTGKMVPHPTDPFAPHVPSAKLTLELDGKLINWEIPIDDNFTMNKLFDRELNGPLSDGMLGNTYTGLLHRPRDVDRAIEDMTRGMDPNINRNFDRARNFRAGKDPFVLDLDGDGIETIGSGSGEVLFDHEGDGIRNGSGWLDSDDGFLVLDRNGNGIIDDGSELFGEQTPGASVVGDPNTLPSDSPELVRSAGLRALSRLDTNADGVFDVNDTQFADVRVWRDMNQDGKSSANELFSLEQLSIASINLNPTSTVNVDLRNGNVIDSTGSFTRIDGSVGTTGDLLLGSNGFYREFTDRIEPSAAAKLLPTLVGAGLVRDLDEAATLDAQLAAEVNAMGIGMSRDAMMGRMDAFLSRWADTSDMKSSTEAMWGDGGVGAVQLNVYGRGPGGSYLLTDIVSILERFNGQHYFVGQGSGVVANGRFWNVLPTAPGSVVDYFVINVELNEAPTQMLMDAYKELRDSVYYSLVMFTRLKDYLSEIDLAVDLVRGFVYDYAAMDQKLRNKAAGGDVMGALDDLYDLQRAGTGLLVGWNWSDTLGWMAEQAQFSGEFSSRAASLFGASVLSGAAGADGGTGNDLGIGGAGSDTISGGDGADVLVGYTGDDSLLAGNGNDKLYGGAGNDNLIGGAGNDVLDGGDGNDVLTDGSGTNILRGGAGDDTLRSDNYWASNTFHGGVGNDRIDGYWGGDRYIFEIGDGHDVIRDNGSYSFTGDYADTLLFGDGIVASDITVVRVSSDLLLTHKNGVDSITVKDWFTSANLWLEKIKFVDGTSWSAHDLTYKVVQAGTDAAQSLIGVSRSNALIRAGGGNDTIVSSDGNDELH